MGAYSTTKRLKEASHRLGSGKPVALVPGKHMLVTPEGAGNGLLILGDSEGSPFCAARALINVVVDMHRDGAC